MILAAHQPNFMPNLGFFYKMFQADKFVLISNLQYEKNEGWQRRHKIKGWQGDLWLTVPTLGSSRQKIREVMIDNVSNWRKKHSKTLAMVYRDTAHPEILEEVIRIYDRKWERLVDLNYALIRLVKDVLDLPGHLILDEEVTGCKCELLINICKKHQAEIYLSGQGGKDYMTADYLRKLDSNQIKPCFLTADVTGAYPYTSLHYLLTEGPEWVKGVVAVQDQCLSTEKALGLSVNNKSHG